MNRVTLRIILLLLPILMILVFTSGARSQNIDTVIRVELYEWGIDVSVTDPQTGPTSLFVTNVGTQPHSLALEGPGASLRFPRELEPGEMEMMWVNLQPGSYRLFDPLDQNAERGMSLEFTTSGMQAQDGGQATAAPGGQPGQGQAASTPTAQPGQGQATPAPTPQAGQATATPGAEQDGNGQQLIQQGEQVFVNNCANCHGQNGQGQIGPALAGNQFVTSDDPIPVIDVVLHGRGQMPAFQGQLENEQIAAVISYIRNAWGNQASTVSPEQVSGGEGQDGQQEGQEQTPAAPQVTLALTAENRSFSEEILTVPPGALVTLNLTNMDNFPHNIAIYEEPAARRALFVGQVFSGPDQTVTYQFTAPAEPGSYYFRCDVHPYMNGEFVVE